MWLPDPARINDDKTVDWTTFVVTEKNVGEIDSDSIGQFALCRAA